MRESNLKHGASRKRPPHRDSDRDDSDDDTDFCGSGKLVIDLEDSDTDTDSAVDAHQTPDTGGTNSWLSGLRGGGGAMSCSGSAVPQSSHSQHKQTVRKTVPPPAPSDNTGDNASGSQYSASCRNINSGELAKAKVRKQAAAAVGNHKTGSKMESRHPEMQGKSQVGHKPGSNSGLCVVVGGDQGGRDHTNPQDAAPADKTKQLCSPAPATPQHTDSVSRDSAQGKNRHASAMSAATTTTFSQAKKDRGKVAGGADKMEVSDPYEFNAKVEDGFGQIPGPCGTVKRMKLDKVGGGDCRRDDGRRDVSTETSLNHVGVMTEPELMGPCEPGTSVVLEGIVWQETENGMLVVNVTWRGKTYVGTLMDATKHEWAPPNLRGESPTSDCGDAAAAAPCSGRAASSSRSTRRAARSTTRAQTHASDSAAERKLRSSRRAAAAAMATADTAGGGVKRKVAGSRGQPEGDGEDGVKASKRSRSEDSMHECPQPHCMKKYKTTSALRYHQTSAHKQIEKPDSSSKESSTKVSVATTAKSGKSKVDEVKLEVVSDVGGDKTQQSEAEKSLDDTSSDSAAPSSKMPTENKSKVTTTNNNNNNAKANNKNSKSSQSAATAVCPKKKKDKKAPAENSEKAQQTLKTTVNPTVKTTVNPTVKMTVGESSSSGKSLVDASSQMKKILELGKSGQKVLVTPLVSAPHVYQLAAGAPVATTTIGGIPVTVTTVTSVTGNKTVRIVEKMPENVAGKKQKVAGSVVAPRPIMPAPGPQQASTGAGLKQIQPKPVVVPDAGGGANVVLPEKKKAKKKKKSKDKADEKNGGNSSKSVVDGGGKTSENGGKSAVVGSNNKGSEKSVIAPDLPPPELQRQPRPRLTLPMDGGQPDVHSPAYSDISDAGGDSAPTLESERPPRLTPATVVVAATQSRLHSQLAAGRGATESSGDTAERKEKAEGGAKPQQQQQQQQQQQKPPPADHSYQLASSWQFRDQQSLPRSIASSPPEQPVNMSVSSAVTRTPPPTLIHDGETSAPAGSQQTERVKAETDDAAYDAAALRARQTEELRRYYMFTQQQQMAKSGGGGGSQTTNAVTQPAVATALPRADNIPQPAAASPKPTAPSPRPASVEERPEERLRCHESMPSPRATPPPPVSCAGHGPSCLQGPGGAFFYPPGAFPPPHVSGFEMGPSPRAAMFPPGFVGFGHGPPPPPPHYLHHPQMSPGGPQPPGPGDPKALDLFQQHAAAAAAAYYSHAAAQQHKIHELKDVKGRGGAASPCGGGVDSRPASRGSDHKSPPPQRHLHTHHHTHVVGAAPPAAAPQYHMFYSSQPGLLGPGGLPPHSSPSGAPPPHPFMPTK